MREKPILFSGPMVRAILEGRKTMTRRAFKEQPDWSIVCGAVDVDGVWYWQNGFDGSLVGRCKLKYAVGDRLWVKESLKRGVNGEVIYMADGDVYPDAEWVWKNAALPSIHCPRGLSRITLEVTAVKVERLQDLSEDDAIAEGVPNSPQWAIDFSTGKFYPGFRYQDGSFSNLPGAYRRAWMELWNSINGTGAWEANPWVAAYTFEVVSVAGRDGQ